MTEASGRSEQFNQSFNQSFSQGFNQGFNPLLAASSPLSAPPPAPTPAPAQFLPTQTASPGEPGRSPTGAGFENESPRSARELAVGAAAAAHLHFDGPPPPHAAPAAALPSAAPSGGAVGAEALLRAAGSAAETAAPAAPALGLEVDVGFAEPAPHSGHGQAAGRANSPRLSRPPPPLVFKVRRTILLFFCLSGAKKAIDM